MVYSAQLKIGMLYHMNNNFRNTTFWISVNVPLTNNMICLNYFQRNNSATNPDSEDFRTCLTKFATEKIVTQ